MRVLSLITPVYRPEPAQLLEAHESLRGQELPAGWEWEWAVQEDGDTGVAASILPSDDPRISFGTGRHAGTAIARNLALSRARGELVKTFDQDDMLTPGVLARDIAVLTDGPDVQWTTSRVLDIFPNGSTAGSDYDPPAGRLEPGELVEHWRSHNYRLPVHPATMCIRRALITALGGWMAVPGSDDTGLLVAASVLSVGYFRSEVGLLYRKWPGQTSAQASHVEPVEWQARMALISERADSLANLWQTRV